MNVRKHVCILTFRAIYSNFSKHTLTKNISNYDNCIDIHLMINTIVITIIATISLKKPYILFYLLGFFLATSDGTRPTLNNTSGGHCKTVNMRMKIYICRDESGNYT